MKKFLIGVASVIVGILAVGYVIVYLAIGFKMMTFSFYKAPTYDRHYYYIKDDGKNSSMITLTTNNELILDRYYIDGRNSAMTRCVFNINGSTYASHIIGPVYSIEKGGIIPFRLTKLDTVPVQAVIRGIEFNRYNTSTQAPFKNGETFKDLIYISDNNLIINGEHFTYIHAIPQEIQTIISAAEKEWNK